MSNVKSKTAQKHFKKIVLVGKYQAEGFSQILKHISEILAKLGCEVFLESETARHSSAHQLPELPTSRFAQNVDLVLVVGGDGTLLGIARQIAGLDIPIVGVNMGTLGYMTDIPIQEAESVITDMMAGRYEQDIRYLLEAKVYRNNALIGEGSALNDVVVNRSGIAGMVELTVNVNGQFMYNQRSDGLIVATPTGSTAYAMSVGGPILHPAVAGMVLAPIAPHALSNRPIVLPSDSQITIELVSGKDVCVNFDMQSLTSLKIGDQIRIERSNKNVTLLHPVGHSDYRAMRQKLHWNEYPSSF